MNFKHSGIIDMKDIALIGSTGSIGKQVLEVVEAHKNSFRIVAMAANADSKTFSAQLWSVRPAYAALANQQVGKTVSEVPQGTTFLTGEQAALAVASYPAADIVVVAASGFAGLAYTLAAIAAHKTVALANKETLVCGGDLVIPEVKKQGVELVPIDSEHSAIWQCLHFHTGAPFQNLIITASGGAFRGYSQQQLQTVTPAQALNHPTWRMGPKITVDSATLLNKGFEVIEAHHLFGAPYQNIKTVIHPQSIVHSMVEFADGAILAQLSNPSMCLPIQAALTYPKRMPCPVKPLSFAEAFSLQFQPLVRADYPCYDLALTCGTQGGILPTVLNAAGEVAVHAFLQGQIGFLQIAGVLFKVVNATPNAPVQSFEQLSATDKQARQQANQVIHQLQN